MIKKQIISIVSILLMAVIVTTNASARNYIGFGLGASSFDSSANGFDENKTSFALRGMIGLRKEYAGVEAELSLSIYDWNSSTSYIVGNNVFSGLVYLNLGDRLDLFAKAGLNISQTMVQNYDTVDNDGYSYSLALGTGANMAFTNKFSLRAEYQLFNDVGPDNDQGDISQFTINGMFYFK